VLAYIPGLVLTGATAFLLGWMIATSRLSEFEVTADIAVFILLAGVSAVAITVPLAISVYTRVPRRARSIFWRRLTWALMNRFIAGSSVAIGVLALVWHPRAMTWTYFAGMAAFVTVTLATSVEMWSSGRKKLTETEQAAREALRFARNLLHKRTKD
jgi:hypothetical protein